MALAKRLVIGKGYSEGGPVEGSKTGTTYGGTTSRVLGASTTNKGGQAKETAISDTPGISKGQVALDRIFGGDIDGGLVPRVNRKSKIGGGDTAGKRRK